MMTRWEAWLQRIAAMAVGGTGLVYAWMRYFVEPAEPFAVVNHPLQPLLLHLHVLAAPLLVFATGMIWRHHVTELLRRGHPFRRSSGLGMVVTLAPMIFAGYLIQVAVDPVWRRVWVIVHLATSALWLVAMLAHHLAARAQSRLAPSPDLDRPAATQQVVPRADAAAGLTHPGEDSDNAVVPQGFARTPAHD